MVQSIFGSLTIVTREFVQKKKKKDCGRANRHKNLAVSLNQMIVLCDLFYIYISYACNRLTHTLSHLYPIEPLAHVVERADNEYLFDWKLM